MKITKAYNFIQIDGLTSSSGTLKMVTLNTLVDAGYEAVINLLPDDSEYAKQGEKEEFEELDLQYVYIPVDWDAPKDADYAEFESALKTFEKQKVHIHCAANYRASAFYAIYAHKHKGWSDPQLHEFIGSIWALSKYPVWQSFVSKLTEPPITS